jgi:ParB-like chromosome segregation protein Spo0J
MKAKTNHKRAIWKNRIVRTAQVPPAKLTENPDNWRAHAAEQAGVVDGILSEVGWVQQIIVNAHTGHIVDGHLRIKLAIERGEKTVPVTYIDVSAAEEKKIILTLNSSGGMATKDADKLAPLLKEVHFNSALIDPLLDELAKDLKLDDGGARGPAPEVEFTEELLEEHNYVVLFFENRVDWINLLSVLDLKTVKAKRSGKGTGFLCQGVGRVIRGPEALAKIQEGKKYGR